MNTPNEYTRISVTVRKSALDDYRKNADNQNISKLVDDTLAEQAAHAKRLKALKTLKQLGPAFPTIENASAYVHDMREEDEARADRLGI